MGKIFFMDEKYSRKMSFEGKLLVKRSIKIFINSKKKRHNAIF